MWFEGRRVEKTKYLNKRNEKKKKNARHLFYNQQYALRIKFYKV